MVTAAGRDSLSAPSLPAYAEDSLIVQASRIQAAFPVVQMVPRVLSALIQIPALVLGYRKVFPFMFVSVWFSGT